MLLVAHQSSRFKRDAKRVRKQGWNLEEMEAVVRVLAACMELQDKYRDHALTGDWKGHRECHIRPDWLLIYVVTGEELHLIRTGSHSELFG